MVKGAAREAERLVRSCVESVLFFEAFDQALQLVFRTMNPEHARSLQRDRDTKIEEAKRDIHRAREALDALDAWLDQAREGSHEG